MANRRVLVKRRKAARNIRKITRTMQLIATARFQAAHNRAIGGKPYTEKLTQLMENLAGAAGGLDHPLMAQHPEAARGALVVLTSNRGLCGGYNTNVLRAAGDFLAAAETPVDVSMVGKKGISYFRFLGSEMAETLTDIADGPRFDQVEPLANRLMARFAAGELATVDVAYTQFVSTARQRPVVERILPLSPQAGNEAAGGGSPAAGREYEFSPAPQELLEELLPASVRVRIYQCFTDAAVSEQIARMVAMKAATDAAGDMIKRLTMQYNRARQTQITMELLDIVGGANALE
jgi:F-type H+-transporting ATPase subunit gamma